MTMQKQKKKNVLTGNTYIQMFMYKIPKINSEAWIEFQKNFSAVLTKNGTLYSEFYKLESSETFNGFESIAKTASVDTNIHELWLEVDHYNNIEHKDMVVEKMNNDKDAGPLFGQLMSLVAEGQAMIMGEFTRIKRE